MKTTLIVICTILFLASCTNTAPDPLLNELNGEWKLVKIGVGFPSPQGPTELQPEYEEILSFNASKGSYTRTKDGKVVEKSDVSISSDEKATYQKDMLVFEESKTYSFISFTETPRYLVLYQPAPIGAVLADGNSFFYEKVK
ncbi:hypothetical protein [Emticicia agri]|uniref:Lipocalin-like domain-containing protein n=1 Tax=Emticicia agri TaxID=2492393 RepID=A0A4Q5LVD9_9BACT|nr:hypothetical protein [Emticicia agri]RYU93701.1 hypothetical protein EWM59_20925 [Emticicia agri]